MPQEARRLTSWKEISAYIGRDVRTVARWERERGLPVRRVPGGRKSSVFAWTHEIDAWLASAAPSDLAMPDFQAAENADPPARPGAASFRRLLRLAGPVALLLLAFVAIVRTDWLHGAETVVGLRVEGPDVMALTATGKTAWTHHFASPMSMTTGDYTGMFDLDGDGRPEALAVLSGHNDPEGRQVFYCFSHTGELRWQVEPRDTYTFGSQTFGPPWNSVGVFPYTVGAARRLLWVTHHHTWWPGVVRMLDADGRELSRFVNPGWITSAAITATGTALLAGTSNAEESDVFAVLDDRSWPGSAPEPSTPGYRCSNCPEGRPARYFLLPRSELNRATQTPRDTSSVSPYPNSIQVQTIQVPGDAQLPSAAIVFEFSTDFRPLSARVNDAYWAWHDRLFREGRIDHPSSRCPERRGFTIREWQRGRGWSTVFVSAGDD